MKAIWLQRCRAWGDRHPRLTAYSEASALLSFVIVGLLASSAVAADILSLGLHFAGRTASHAGIILSTSGKSAWVVTGGMLLIPILFYTRHVQSLCKRLSGSALLSLCIMTTSFAVLIDTISGHMSATIVLEGDNDWVIAALKFWAWATWAVCALPIAEWTQRKADDRNLQSFG